MKKSKKIFVIDEKDGNVEYTISVKKERDDTRKYEMRKSNNRSWNNPNEKLITATENDELSVEFKSDFLKCKMSYGDLATLSVLLNYMLQENLTYVAEEQNEDNH